jgi:hypothetical protein
LPLPAEILEVLQSYLRLERPLTPSGDFVADLVNMVAKRVGRAKLDDIGERAAATAAFLLEVWSTRVAM